jgi:hypothetical protein
MTLELQTEVKSERRARKKNSGGNESKAAKFSRLATARFNDVLRKIGNIGKLATSQYEYTDEQVRKMDKLLTESWAETVGKFRTRGKTKRDEVSI